MEKSLVLLLILILFILKDWEEAAEPRTSWGGVRLETGQLRSLNKRRAFKDTKSKPNTSDPKEVGEHEGHQEEDIQWTDKDQRTTRHG